MQGGGKYTSTETFKRFANRNVSDCDTFRDKLMCARVNYSKGKGAKKGLSLRAAAKKIGVTSVYLRQIEMGERKVPNAVIIHNIEALYGFEQGYLAKLLSSEQKVDNKGA
ncbi:helix-turn-helix protein [Anaerobacterium chartisolvens]|uniref:Helix-turn-helix protein n=1 Tax=Anaerobacterium chartisolvens TaxID=1297424 RepID=A0A369BH88_9FIRM|nr:helix-turn-helix domain-containing protein [Anaerobacterium chartisolvens]RCX20922.1 helix-turn-helix protein [Anaerobacterium chartisolvens]